MPNVFFRATEDALDKITAVFDFIHPLRASYLYTRNVINHEHAINSNLNNKDFQQLIDPKNVIHGVNYRKAFIDTTYEYQEELLSWVLLNNIFAIHEGWAQRIYDEVFVSFGYNERAFIKKLEYDNLTSEMKSYFVKSSKKSKITTNAFWNTYLSASKLDISKLDNYMLMYRFFKELRNCFMHNNFSASQNVIDAYNAYNVIANQSDLCIDEVPVIDSPTINTPIKLNIRGVIGFSHFIQRILIISDLYLLQTKAAEMELVNRKPQSWNIQTLSSDPSRCKGQITRYATKSGLLKPVYSEDLKNFLISHEIFTK